MQTILTNSEIDQVTKGGYTAYYERYTRPGSDHGHRDWQRQLTELDEKLFLRFNLLTHKFSVYFEYRGKKSPVGHIDAENPFGLVLRNLRKNAATSRSEILRSFEELEEEHEREVAQKIQEGAEQFATDLVDIVHGKKYFHS